MAKVRKKDKDVLKWKKKKWYSIFAPRIFNSLLLGETTVVDASKVVGKHIKVNLMNLTGEVRNQNVNVTFRVTGFKDQKAETEVVGFMLSPAYIKRAVRRKHTRVDTMFKVKTKDERTLTLKPIMITRNIASRSEATALRNNTRETLTKIAGTYSYDDLVKGMIQHRLQADLRKRLSKIYPLKTFELKRMNLQEA